ncbi:DUF3606 domain-containing protein, partial [Mesorhizobium sp. M7A.F.Ca.US.001.02.1.1]
DAAIGLIQAGCSLAVSPGGTGGADLCYVVLIAGAEGCAFPRQQKARPEMADDKSKTKQDRKQVSGEEPYEVAAFARKYGIPPSEAQTIIKRYGPSRKKLDAHMAARG